MSPERAGYRKTQGEALRNHIPPFRGFISEVNKVELKGVALTMFLFTACQPGKKQEDSSEIAKARNTEVIDDRDDEKDADIIVNAVAANLAEINLAQLTSSKSTDSEIKEIAAMLETDQTTYYTVCRVRCQK